MFSDIVFVYIVYIVFFDVLLLLIVFATHSYQGQESLRNVICWQSRLNQKPQCIARTALPGLRYPSADLVRAWVSKLQAHCFCALKTDCEAILLPEVAILIELNSDKATTS